MSLAIIIINFRTPQYTEDCLSSIEPERASVPGLRVVLVENASGDDSLPRLREAIAKRGWSSWVDLLPQEKNLGFAGGNNAGLKHVRASAAEDYVLFLNSDTIVHPGCLAACIRAMRADSGIGILSCMLENRDGSVQNICWRFPSPVRETARAFALPYFFQRGFRWADVTDKTWDRRAGPRDVEWVGGAFMMLRTETLKRLGGMDDSFFFYGEDIEFCHRMHRNGLRVRFDPAGTITHFGGASSDPTRLADRRRATLLWAARFGVQKKLYGPLAALWLRFIYILVFSIKVAWLFVSGRRGSPNFAGARAGLSVLTHPLKT